MQVVSRLCVVGDWTEELVPIACVYLIWATDGWAQSVNCHLIHSG